jgi:hypothetical protein
MRNNLLAIYLVAKTYDVVEVTTRHALDIHEDQVPSMAVICAKDDEQSKNDNKLKALAIKKALLHIVGSQFHSPRTWCSRHP